MRWKGLAVGAAAMWMAAASAVPAAAGLSERSEVSLNVSRAPTFRGQVTSPDRFCDEDRKVILYAFGTGGQRYPFGTDRTNAKGKWSVSEQLDGATTFQARVTASTAKGLRCLADSSPMMTISL